MSTADVASCILIRVEVAGPSEELMGCSDTAQENKPAMGSNPNCKRKQRTATDPATTRPRYTGQCVTNSTRIYEALPHSSLPTTRSLPPGSR